MIRSRNYVINWIVQEIDSLEDMRSCGEDFIDE